VAAGGEAEDGGHWGGICGCVGVIGISVWEVMVGERLREKGVVVAAVLVGK
jgi:hypothetical protein